MIKFPLNKSYYYKELQYKRKDKIHIQLTKLSSLIKSRNKTIKEIVDNVHMYEVMDHQSKLTEIF